AEDQLAGSGGHRPWAAGGDKPGQPPPAGERMKQDVVIPDGQRRCGVRAHAESAELPCELARRSPTGAGPDLEYFAFGAESTGPALNGPGERAHHRRDGVRTGGGSYEVLLCPKGGAEHFLSCQRDQ